MHVCLLIYLFVLSKYKIYEIVVSTRILSHVF